MKDQSSNPFHRLIDIGIALSAEHNTDRLTERILLEAKEFCNADGGTLYLRSDDTLKFEIMHTDSLNLALGGTTGKPIDFPPLLMRNPDTGEENKKNVATWAAISGNSVNILDAYQTGDFDFTGTKTFDRSMGYRSKSFLTVPLKNSQDEVIGVLQLVNAQDPVTGEITAFDKTIQPLIESLASQAAVALDKQQLLDAQKQLMVSFIELIASAIDAKSPYTGGHCQRVPVLTKMLAQAACDSIDGPFAKFNMTEEQMYELHVSAWLHDCGKVTTPEYVVDKSTKLETIYDRIHEVRMRFEVVKRDAVIEHLKAIIKDGNRAKLEQDLDERLAEIDDDFNFIAECNIGQEFMAPESIERIKSIAKTQWTRTLSDRIGISPEEKSRKNKTPDPELPVLEDLISDRDDHLIIRESVMSNDNPYGFKLDIPEYKYNLGEVYNLSVNRGTLTKEERFKINDHIVQTIMMLEQLPFPKYLARVPEYAGGHHEKMNGTGYPRKLFKNQMSIPARIMAIADIFEALTAADRPYKSPKLLSESIKIMAAMKKDDHIDGELFELFLTSGVYEKFARQFLMPSQIDEVDISEHVQCGPKGKT